MVKIRFHGDDNQKNIELEIVPAIQKNLITTIVTEQSEKERIYSFLEDISINAKISEEGIVSEKDQ